MQQDPVITTALRMYRLMWHNKLQTIYYDKLYTISRAILQGAKICYSCGLPTNQVIIYPQIYFTILYHKLPLML